jgi:hypothetical protein
MAEKAAKEEWSSAFDTMFGKLAEKLPMLKDPDVARQIRENAVKSDDVMDQVYNVQAGVILPQLVAERNTLTAKVAELESVITDLNGAKPNTDGRQEVVKGDDEFKNMSPSEAARRAGFA